MSVTQKQIAEKLNISPSLVGRALSGHPEVAEKTKLRVEAVAKEMGYSATANSAARALIAKRYGQTWRKGILAVAFPPLDLSSRHVPFYTPVIAGMEAEAAQQGIELYFCTLRPNELPVLVREQGVDGIIMLGSSVTSAAAVAMVEKLSLPALTVQWRCGGARSVVPDDYDGLRQATRHLLELGHRRIGYLGIERFKKHWDAANAEPPAAGDIVSFAGMQRLQGYLDAMNEHGIQVPNDWIENSLPLQTLSSAYCPGCGACASCSAWSQLRERNAVDAESNGSPFTAVVCHNDSVAMGAIVQAQKDGLTVPGDLSVVGFDHISGEFNFHPELTSVNFSRFEMGSRAVQLLNDAVKDRAAEKVESPAWHRVLPVEVLAGESTQALRAPALTAC